MVAYYFPPLGGIGSIRASKFATYLPRTGWSPTILAPENASGPRDDTLEYDRQSVVRTRSFEISRFGKRIAGVAAGSPIPSRGSIHHSLRQLVHRYVYYPDAQVGWYPFAVRAGRAALAQGGYDAIFSSSFPITSHLVARCLHRETGIPWVAEFRDPWADVPGGAGSAQRRDRLERSILCEADAIITVSPAWKELFEGKGAAEVHVVSNGFDAADLPPTPVVAGFTVTHLGSFYPGLQDLRVVWKALGMVRAGDPGLAVRVRFIGEPGPGLREEIAGCGLGDLLEVTGLLPHRQALAEAAASTVLIAASFPRGYAFHQGVIPAKLFEYLATGLPILYVGTADTDAARLLASQPACRIVDPRDVDGALEALLMLQHAGRVARELGSYTRLALARRLAEILESVCR